MNRFAYLISFIKIKSRRSRTDRRAAQIEGIGEKRSNSGRRERPDRREGPRATAKLVTDGDCSATGKGVPFCYLSAREALAVALDIKVQTGQRLSTFAEMFTGYDDDMVAIFREMAAEEADYENTLRSLYRELYPSSSPDVSDLSEDLAIEVIEAFDLPDGECFIFNTLKPVDALSMAIKAEEDALAYYLDLTTTAQDPRLLDVYNTLAEIEEKHIGHLRTQIASLGNSGEKQ